MERITARTNEKIKYAASLLSASGRAAHGEFLAEGARLCADAAQSGVKITRAFFTGQALEKYKSYINHILEVCGECYEITPEVAEKLSDTKVNQGVFAVCCMNESENSFSCGGKYILAENLQDPSNLGAICRSIEALGLDGIIVCGGCDIYNPKALRSSMGSAFRINIFNTADTVSFLQDAKQNGMKTFAAVLDKDSTDIRDADFSSGVICCVGNEGNGLSKEAADACGFKIKIPMKGKAESLNASAAAAILAWETVR